MERLAAADVLIRAGCLDCLAAAYQDYESLLSIPEAHDVATIGLVEAATLLAIRERELGMEDTGYLDRARDIAASSSLFSSTTRTLFDIVDIVPLGGGGEPADDADFNRRLAGYRNRGTDSDYLRERADHDALSAYLWLAFNCAYETSGPDRVVDWVETLPTWRDTSLISFKASTCSGDGSGLDRLLQADPRFIEINYVAAGFEARAGKVDEAVARLEQAYTWHPRWPAATSALAHAYLSEEEFERAAQFFDRTLLMLPDAPEALLGKARALTYLRRHDEAVATLDRLLALNGWLLGDARYWRALNESQLGKYEVAWEDIERAAKLLSNAEVPKLAGIIAYRRQQLAVAAAKFQESRRRNPEDCETGFYFGVVLSEQQAWSSATDVFGETAACLDREERQLRQAIERIRASHDSTDRQARQISRYERDIAADHRMLATTWFDMAVAYYVLSRRDDARRFAEKVSDDTEFGERARDRLAKLR